MLRTKKDVDRHVRDVLNKVRTEDERKLRGYNISRLYFNIGEYESARRYLSEFLSVRPKAVDAHRLLGQIFEGLNLKEKAVQAYKTSYELGEGQRDLVLKICELYCDVPCDHSVRQYWADEGDRLFPHHEKVIRLREAIITASNSESREELEKLYFDEIKANPLRVKLYTSLLQLYKHWEGREKDAYKYGCGIESRKAFPDSLEWYQTLCDTLETYQNTADVNEDAEFHVNYLSVLERLVYLTLASCTGTALLSQCTQTDVVALLHKFDQNLTISLKVVGEDSIFGQLMIGQLFLHMASILLQGTKKDALLEANVSSGALLFHACRFLPCESCHPSKSQTSQDQFWYKLSCHRLSQAYHVIHHMAKSETEKSQFLEKIKEKTGNKEAQENIYRAVFGSSGSSSMEASFFVNYDKFYLSATCLSYPELEQVKKWDSVVGSMYCSSLRDMVWLCLQQAPCNLREPQPYYTFTLFEGLQFATNKMNTGAAETLCHLDLLAFLVATVYCQNTLAKSTHGPTPASHPTVVTSVLNTNEQAEWWSAAYMLFTNKAHHRLNKLRLTLQRGLEVIRAIGNHGVDLVLMAHLAQCFTKWAQTAKNDGSTRSEVDALEERAKHYWDCVLTMCQKIARNPSTIIPRNRLFIVHSESFSPAEIEKVQEEGKYFVAMRLAHAGRKQEAIQALGNLKSPESSYERAMLYKEQAQALLLGSNEESITAELRSQYTSLLRQARDTLYLTLDRLRMPGVDRVHPLNAKLSQQLEDVERKLSSISSDADIQREEDTESLSDDSQSQRLDLSNGHAIACQPGRMFSTPVREIRNSTRIARQEARPSPERLDAQVRAITDIQEHTLRNMEEQNAALRSQNEALRKLCTSINEDFKENNALYRSIMEQNKAPSTEVFASLITEIKQIPNNFQDAFTSLLNEVKQMQSSIHHLESDVRSIARNVEVVVEILKTERKQPERTDAKLEEQVPVEIPPAAAAVVPPGLNSIFYYDQQQIPYNYRPSASFLRFPPFSPPSTLADQAYSLSSTVAQAAVISTLAQASGAVVTPTPSSASAVNKEAVPSPAAGISVAQGISQGNFNSLSWTVTPTLHATSVSSPDVVSSKEATSTPAHNYQIAMPITVSALTPPPGSTPGEQSSLSLPCSTAGLLANVPAPLYSAVTPDNSPLRGQSKVKSLSSATVLSPEGLATSAVGNREVSATHSSDAKDGSFIAESPEGGGQGSPNKTRDATDDEEHDPCPDYKPRIPLPEKVEVRTGEEDEQVLFEERAKLFRYVDKEWRERGTGVIKLLHNPAQGSVRVLMRRDQTHKVCANHLVLSSMDIQPMKNNDRAWMWAAQDYADEEIRPEKFCCRFKTVEIATAFKDAFRKAKEFAKMKEDSSDHQELQVVPRKADDQTGISGPKTLREMFKPAEGSWNCDTCLVNNKPDSDKCEACHSPNPNASNKDIDSTNETQSSPYATFKFSSTSAVTTTSASKPFSFTYTSMVTSSTSASTETTSSFSLSASDVISSTATNAVIPTSVTSTTPLAAASTGASGKGKFMFSGFSFFTPPSVQAEKNEEVAQKPMSEDKKKVFANFTFANIDSKSPVSSTFSFSTPASENKLAVGGIFSGTANTGHMVSFGSISAESTPTASIFKTTDVKSFEPKPLFGLSSGKTPSKDDSKDEVDEDEPQKDFVPVVPLPDLVEVKTGEEEEVALFCERCKLFRYDKEAKEWKERGVGELKILKNNTTGKVRILMRRDQVHKICANHFVTADVKLTPMQTSDKTWVWATHDFADEEMKEVNFAARFKTPEIALSFKSAFESAQKSLDDVPRSVAEGSAFTETQVLDQPKTTPLSEMFKPQKGSWECGTCLVSNGPEVDTCLACASKKPDVHDRKEKSPVSEEKTREKSPVSEEKTQEISALSEGKTEDPKASSLSSLFKPPAGSWECSTCLVRNKGEDTVCIACGAGGASDAGSFSSEVKSAFSFGIEKDNLTSDSAVLPSSGFKFGVSDKKQTFSFGTPTATSSSVPTSSTQSTYTFGVPSQLPAKTDATDTGSKATFMFGISIPTSSTDSSKNENKPVFAFGNTNGQPSNAFTFSSVSKPIETSTTSTITSGAAPTTPVKDAKADFVFGSPGKYDFSFSGIRAKSPRSRDISLCESEEGVIDEEDEGDHLYFEPKIPLPDKIEVITGEENESVLYSSRAKLHRLVSGEWKERGIGDVKVLEHKESGKIRLLMRREQIHKICMNHYINKDMDLRKKDEKTFYWASVDYSENAPQNETFAIRFKTPEIATDFYKAVDDAKVKLGGKHTEMPVVVPSPKKTEVSSSSTSTPTATFVAADSTTPAATSTPGSIFGGMNGKSMFGGTVGLSGSIFGGSSPKPSEPSFTVNVSSSFTLKSPNASQSHVSGGGLLFGGTSAFGDAAAVTPRAPLFSFGDRFSSQDSSFGKTSSLFSSQEDESVQIVFEKKATPSQVERARALKLPDNFFLYEEAPPCPGCRGCEERSGSSEKESQDTTGDTQLDSSVPSHSAQESTPSVLNKDAISGLFGANKTTSIFGGTAATTSGIIFGGISTPTTGGIFGGVNTIPANSVFGGSAAASPSIFGTAATIGTLGTPAATTTSNLLGGTSTPGLLGSPVTSVATTTIVSSSSTTTPNIFGSSSGTTTSLYGSGTPTASIFSLSTATTTSSIFGTSTPITSTSAQGLGTTTTSVIYASPANLFGSQTSASPRLFGNNNAATISFADIKDSPHNFGQTSQAYSDVWSASGQPVFSRASPKKDADTTNEDEDDSYDPHFKPLIPLPELVEIRTGEENMEVIFSNRGKLYRYDSPTKQWKERGVGDFKILHDPTNSKYRLLMRREQVYKTCCNHYLTPQLQLRQMQNSESAWCWYAIDFSENMEGTNEKLAIRFKTKELALEFKAKFEECQKKLKNMPTVAVPESASATIVLPSESQPVKKNTVEEYEEEEDEDDDEDEEEEDEDDDDDDDDDDEDEEDDVENTVIFLKRCSLLKKENGDWKNLGMGDLRIIYDDEFYGARILMVSDGGETLAEHVIAIQTTMFKEGNSAVWTVLNLKPSPPSQVTFKAQFSSHQALEEFASAFSEGKEYAEKAGIMEEVISEVAPEDLYYGQGAQGTQAYGSMTSLGKNAFPFSFGQVVSCDPNLTKDIAAALQEYFPTNNSNSDQD